MRTCKTCLEDKPISEYYKDGKFYRGSCKCCIKAERVAYRAANPDKIKASNSRSWENNKDKYSAANREYYVANRKSIREKQQQYYRANKAKYLANNSNARAALYQATPKYLTDLDKGRIEIMYEARDRLTELTGIEHHVDHIIPLRGKNICGLHIPRNLRVITAEENLRKGNRYE